MTVRYITALCVIAAVALGGGIVLRLAMQEQTGDALVINLAGRQRMLSQKLSKEAVISIGAAHPRLRQRAIDDLRRTLDRLKVSHGALRSASPDVGFTGPNNPEVTRLFAALQPLYDSLVGSVEGLLAASAAGGSDPARHAVAAQRVEGILAVEAAFLSTMDAIVTEYERDAARKLDRLKALEAALLMAILLIVVLVGVLVLHPAVAATT